VVRILSLLWTFVASFVASTVSFFYLRDNGEKHGFPFTFAKEVVVDGTAQLQYSIWSYLFDVIFWWFLFSILLIIIKNYVLEVD
jgi:hypothetical protein